MNFNAIKRTVKNELQVLLHWNRYKPLNRSPHGHFYSPVVSKNDIDAFKDTIFGSHSDTPLPGIDMQTAHQHQLLDAFSAYYPELPFLEKKNKNTRYHLNNPSYEYTDGIMLYSFLRHFKPRKVIEIGSGFSSALMLDMRDIFNKNLDLLFIEPYPQVLNTLIDDNDRAHCRVLNSMVQNVNIDEFRSLEKNDILFIDSSHVSKTGSDVNFELFEILPVLQSGVIIHFHDIFYPFEYPKEWVYEGRNWNEAYMLKAFLSYNSHYSIELFPHYMHTHHASAFEKMPLTYKNTGATIWLRKA